MEAPAPFYERYAWVLVAVVGGILAMGGIGYLATGLNQQPDYVLALPEGRTSTAPLLEQSPAELTPILRNSLTEWGIMQAALGVLVVVLAAVPLRRAEPWAWVALWVVPLALLGANLNAARVGASLGPLPVFLAIGVLGLLLSVRAFLGPRATKSTQRSSV
jgi:hypothetical protein